MLTPAIAASVYPHPRKFGEVIEDTEGMSLTPPELVKHISTTKCQVCPEPLHFSAEVVGDFLTFFDAHRRTPGVVSHDLQNYLVLDPGPILQVLAPKPAGLFSNSDDTRDGTVRVVGDVPAACHFFFMFLS